MEKKRQTEKGQAFNNRSIAKQKKKDIFRGWRKEGRKKRERESSRYERDVDKEGSNAKQCKSTTECSPTQRTELLWERFFLSFALCSVLFCSCPVLPLFFTVFVVSLVQQSPIEVLFVVAVNVVCYGVMVGMGRISLCSYVSVIVMGIGKKRKTQRQKGRATIGAEEKPNWFQFPLLPNWDTFLRNLKKGWRKRGEPPNWR